MQIGCGELFLRYVHRAVVEQVRDKKSFIIDNVTVLVAGILLGLMAFIPDDAKQCPHCHWMVPGVSKIALEGCSARLVPALQELFLATGDRILQRASTVLICIGLTAATSVVRVFGRDKQVLLREASHMQQPSHTMAYFWGKDAAYLPQQFIGPAVFLLAYHAIAAPRCSFASAYLPLAATYYASSGVSYITSVLGPRAVAMQARDAVISTFIHMFLEGG